MSSKQKNKAVLIVDDEYFLVEMLKDRLEFLGYRVVMAENGREALDILKGDPVDLVVMDVIMPVMDGLEATRHIKQDKQLKKIPVLVLTARAQPQDEKAAYAAGAEDYLAKPFEMDTFTAKIKKWTEK